jgi:3'-5' exoribonuclease 1
MIVTDGPWDIQRFIHPECMRKSVYLEPYWNTWVNIRSIFMQTSYAGYDGGVPADDDSISLTQMLAATGLKFEGRKHSGIDDARNIARISARLLYDGIRLSPNMEM